MEKFQRFVLLDNKNTEKIVVKPEDVKPSTGHKPHTTGTGPFKNKKYDKKMRRKEDKSKSEE